MFMTTELILEDCECDSGLFETWDHVFEQMVTNEVQERSGPALMKALWVDPANREFARIAGRVYRAQLKRDPVRYAAYRRAKAASKRRRRARLKNSDPAAYQALLAAEREYKGRWRQNKREREARDPAYRQEAEARRERERARGRVRESLRRKAMRADRPKWQAYVAQTNAARKRRQNDPKVREAARASRERYIERLRADPVKWADHLARHRAANEKYREKKRREREAAKT